MSSDPTTTMLLCADACPEVSRVARRDPAIMSDRRVLDQLLRLEHCFLPSSDYFADRSQAELQPYMRRVVTTWMLEVTEEQNCEEQVFPLAVNLLDRFLSAAEAPGLERTQLQLLGCVCLLTASKLRQCRPIGVDLLVYYTDYSVTPAQIRVWEMLLLSKLGWDVSGVTAFDFVDHLMERLPSTTTSTSASILRAHALTHVSLCCTETDYMRARPSIVAAACIAAAASRLGHQDDHLVLVLASLVNTQAEELALVVHSIETLMSAQLASVQQQQQLEQQQQQVQQQQQIQHQQQHLKNSTTTVSSKQTTTSSTWELDVQPETPTDIQDIHF